MASGTRRAAGGVRDDVSRVIGHGSRQEAPSVSSTNLVVSASGGEGDGGMTGLVSVTIVVGIGSRPTQKRATGLGHARRTSCSGDGGFLIEPSGMWSGVPRSKVCTNE